MRIPAQSRSSEVGINMTPMIDVVFQLIIFFLVSSHLAKQEAQMQLPLPIADSGVDAESESRARLTLNVTSDGDLILAGRRIAPEDLSERLRERLAADGPDLEVRIRGDRRVEYREVEPIMLACARNGIWNVTFAVYRTEDMR